MDADDDRQDARLKVTGTATYAAEHQLRGLAYAALVQSTIAKGMVLKIDARAALQNPGVLLILTPETMPKLTPPNSQAAGRLGEDRLPLQDLNVHYNGQHLALVVAETLEAAQGAASLVRVDYEPQPAVVEIEQSIDTFEPKDFFGIYELQYRRGDAVAGLASAATKLESVYETPVEHHNPIEPHATIAAWEGDRLILYDTTQGVVGTQDVLATVLGLQIDQVRVSAPFLGGGLAARVLFGRAQSWRPSLRVWPVGQ